VRAEDETGECPVFAALSVRLVQEFVLKASSHNVFLKEKGFSAILKQPVGSKI
jgi:hypothetical protein